MEMKRNRLFAHRQGFTLVELMVVVGITITVGVMVANIFAINLRTTAKNRALTEVKQSGDYALSIMERMIRNSEAVDCPAGDRLELSNFDGGTTAFFIDADRIASESAYSGLNTITGYLTSDELTATDLVFVWTERTGKPDIVDISFDLAKTGTALGQEFSAAIPFRTTVSTRTY